MTVLRTLRQTDRETRVLILSARSEVEDKVQGLDAGANDYLAKPFQMCIRDSCHTISVSGRACRGCGEGRDGQGKHHRKRKHQRQQGG